MGKALLWAAHHDYVLNKADGSPAFLERRCCQCLKHAKLFPTSRPLSMCPFYLEWSFLHAFLTLTPIHPPCLKFCFLRQGLLNYRPRSNRNKILLLSFLNVSVTFIPEHDDSLFVSLFFFLLPPPLDHQLPEVTDCIDFCLLLYLPHLRLSWFSVGFSGMCWFSNNWQY